MKRRWDVSLDEAMEAFEHTRDELEAADREDLPLFFDQFSDREGGDEPFENACDPDRRLP